MAGQSISYLPFLAVLLAAVLVGVVVGILDLRITRRKQEPTLVEQKSEVQQRRAA